MALERGLYVLAPDDADCWIIVDFIPTILDTRGLYRRAIERMYGKYAFIQGMKENAEDYIGKHV